MTNIDVAGRVTLNEYHMEIEPSVLLYYCSMFSNQIIGGRHEV